MPKFGAASSATDRRAMTSTQLAKASCCTCATDATCFHAPILFVCSVKTSRLHAHPFDTLIQALEGQDKRLKEIEDNLVRERAVLEKKEQAAPPLPSPFPPQPPPLPPTFSSQFYSSPPPTHRMLLSRNLSSAKNPNTSSSCNTPSLKSKAPNWYLPPVPTNPTPSLSNFFHPQEVACALERERSERDAFFRETQALREQLTSAQVPHPAPCPFPLFHAQTSRFHCSHHDCSVALLLVQFNARHRQRPPKPPPPSCEWRGRWLGCSSPCNFLSFFTRICSSRA